MGQNASNQNIQDDPLNNDSLEIESNNQVPPNNSDNNIEFESINDGGEIIYAPPKVIHSPIIKCLVNIHPKSLQFEQNNLGQWRMKFTIDCEQDALIEIFYSARDVGEKDEFVFKPSKEGRFNSVVKVNKGYNLEVQQDWDDSVNFSIFKSEELKYDIVSKRYPLIIVAKALESGYNFSLNDEKNVQKNSNIQVSYFNLTRTEEEITPHLLQQKIKYNTHSYIVQEIYGVESSQGGECVVCMSEPRNVVVLPCRHMCLCILCADIYRIKTNKCPICRGPSRSFIKVNDDKGEDEEEKESSSTTSNLTSNSTVNSPNSLYFEDDV